MVREVILTHSRAARWIKHPSRIWREKQRASRGRYRVFSQNNHNSRGKRPMTSIGILQAKARAQIILL